MPEIKGKFSIIVSENAPKEEGFLANIKVFCPIIKGAGNNEVNKYIALNQLGVNVCGQANVHEGGVPIFEKGGNGRVDAYTAYIGREEEIVNSDPARGALTAIEYLTEHGFKELDGVLIRLV